MKKYLVSFALLVVSLVAFGTTASALKVEFVEDPYGLVRQGPFVDSENGEIRFNFNGSMITSMASITNTYPDFKNSYHTYTAPEGKWLSGLGVSCRGKYNLTYKDAAGNVVLDIRIELETGDLPLMGGCGNVMERNKSFATDVPGYYPSGSGFGSNTGTDGGHGSCYSYIECSSYSGVGNGGTGSPGGSGGDGSGSGGNGSGSGGDGSGSGGDGSGSGGNGSGSGGDGSGSGGDGSGSGGDGSGSGGDGSGSGGNGSGSSSCSSAICKCIEQLSGPVGQIKDAVNGQLTDTNNKLDTANDHLGNANDKLDTANGNLSDLKDISNGIKEEVIAFHNDNEKQLTDVNKNLVEVNDSVEDLHDEFKTDEEFHIKDLPDISNVLDENRPVENQVPFKDETIYFKDEGDALDADPGPLPKAPEPKHWDGFLPQDAMPAEKELTTESELKRDNENKKSDELKVESFKQDEQMKVDSFQKSDQMQVDSFKQADEFNKTNIFQQTNKFP